MFHSVSQLCRRWEEGTGAMELSRKLFTAVVLVMLLLVATGTRACLIYHASLDSSSGTVYWSEMLLHAVSVTCILASISCRDRGGGGGGGEDVPVAEPQVPRPLRAPGKLRQRLQDRGLPRRQVPRLPPPLLLPHALPQLIRSIGRGSMHACLPGGECMRRARRFRSLLPCRRALIARTVHE